MSTSKTDEKIADVEAIVPDEIRVTVDGVDCRVKRLKTREFLSLMRVLTAGLGPGLGAVSIDFTDSESASRDLAALMLLAVPNALPEFTVFLAGVVEPVDGEQAGKVARYLHDNPDLDVMLVVFEAIATQEKDDLSALVGKVQAMWGRLANLYSPKKTTG